jgi:uncharacterized protein (DUF362 family)
MEVHSMDRRTFVRRSLGAVVAGAVLKDASWGELFAQNASPYDLVAVKGGEPEAMFDKGIEALGGMKAFVKKGQKVVVKPNIGWDVGPERAGNTNPKLVKRIVEQCYQAGAKEVYVFDHTCDDWQRSYKTSGIERYAKDGGAKVTPAHTDSYYHKMPVKGKSLHDVQVHELIMESDVFINVPILKHHGSAQLTMGMKNLMGVVWDRQYWHRNDLHQCIADYAGVRKPDLNVIDAYQVLRQNGPRGVSVSDVVSMKAQLLSRDIVAIDAAGAKLMGIDPTNIGHIRLAAEAGVGRMDLDKLAIQRLSI